MYAAQYSADHHEEAHAFGPDITAKEELLVEIVNVKSSPEIGPSKNDLDKMSKEHEEYLASLLAVANAETDHVKLT